MKLSTIILLLFSFLHIQGQENSVPKILSPEDFINIVKEFHPVAKLANINVEKAKAGVTTARGGFDPSVYYNNDQKTFNGKDYYTYINPELKIPAWYGIEIKAGFETNGGQYLNSEASEGRSSYLGLSVPLAKNLLMDKRRAALQQAKIYQQQTAAERQNAINDLLFDAYSVYWNWVKEHAVYKVLSDAVDINEQRFELVKIGFRQGDRPAIDTIEALAQLQAFQFAKSESWVRLQNVLLDMSAYLWLPGGNYYQLPADVRPSEKWNETDISSLQLMMLDDILYNAKLTHPKLKIFGFKLQSLEVERKLKFQSLLPTVNVKGYVLNKGYNMFNGLGKWGFYENNNKFGVELGIPLRLSEGRGAYKTAKLKIQETVLEQSLQLVAMENKIRSYHNEMTGLLQQVKLYEQAYKNYRSLFRGEETRFKAGESSLFLLNSRENKQLEALQKLLELKTKFYKSRQAVLWAAGQLK